MTNYAAMTDHELVALYEQGIDEAFDVLLARNQERVFAYIVCLTQDQDRANDVFQETFMKAIVCIRRHQYRATGKFSAWLMRIAHNLVLDEARNNKNMLRMDSEEQEEVIYNNLDFSEECHEAEMLRTCDKQTLAHMVALLPQAQQEVVYLRFFEELSFKEIARITGVSINTALGRIRYATLNLRKMIMENSLSLAV